MKRFRAPLTFLLVCLCFAILLAGLLQADTTQTTTQPQPFSVVLYGDSADRWFSFRQGLNQACEELGLPKPGLTLLSGNYGPEEQKSLIEREYNNGAKGLIVAACDSEDMLEFLTQFSFQLPLITVETGAGDLPNIATDDTAMGAELARQLCDTRAKDVVVLQAHMYRQSVQLRYAAFVDEAAKLGLSYTVWNCEAQDPAQTDVAAYVAGRLSAARAGTLVAFDNEALESTAEALRTAEGAPLLYGIGTSERVVYFLDSGIITGICFQNEFNMGYLSVKRLAGEMGILQPQTDVPIEYEYVHKENMYDPDIERLLFPMVQ